MYSNCQIYRPDRKPPMGAVMNPYLPINQGLVLNSIMWEGAGDTVEDLSGNGNTGTLVADTHWVPGKFGPVLDFDGTGDYVDCGLMPGVDGVGALTVSCWVKVPDTPATTQMIVAKYGDGGNRCFYLHVRSSNTVYFGVYDFDAGESLAWKTNALVANVWRHIVGVYDGANVRVYADTIPGADVVQTGVTDASTVKMAIGSEKGESSRSPFLGQIDNVMIYNRALSASEIAQVTAQPFCMFETKRTYSTAAVTVVPQLQLLRQMWAA